MNLETAKALNEMRKAVAKAHNVDETEVKMTVCEATKLPFDEDHNCISCGLHESEPLWYCPKCGEYIPDLPDELF